MRNSSQTRSRKPSSADASPSVPAAGPDQAEQIVQLPSCLESPSPAFPVDGYEPAAEPLGEDCQAVCSYPSSPARKTKVLVVDDSKINLSLVQSYLARMNLSSRIATNGREALDLAAELQPDLILLDIMMPDVDGMEVCRRLKLNPATAAIPIIFVSARQEISDKVAGMALGAVDYITKPFNPSELGIRVRSALRTKALQDKLTAQAKTDALTGLYNWRSFYEILTREVDRSRLSSEPLSLILIDLDMFKVVNDSYGHLMGDKLLCDLGEMICKQARPTDYVARYGGDELALVLPFTTAEDAKALAERLRNKLAQTNFGDDDYFVEIACSFGVASIGPGDKASTEALVRRADEALYAAKREGRNRVCLWNPAQEAELWRADPSTSRDLYRMRTHVAAINAKSRKQAMESMWTLARALEARDIYSAHHSENVMHYAEAIARRMGLAPQFVQHIRNASILHDIGKIGVPDRVLKKVGPLTSSEWELMKQHPLISADILGQLTILKAEVLSVRHHHEHFDGSGYPEGLKARDIPIGARVLAVADAFDAITSDRLYRPASPYQQAIDEINRCSGSQFDPEVVQAFMDAAGARNGAWPIGRSASRPLAGQIDLWESTELSDLLDPSAEQGPQDRWMELQYKIEQAIAALAESFDHMTASRTRQDLNRLTVIITQFRTQAAELSALAESVPDNPLSECSSQNT